MKAVLVAALGLFGSSVCCGSIIGLQHENEHTLENDALGAPLQKRASANTTTNGTSITSEKSAVNCSDPSTGMANRCWEELKLDDYISNFSKNHTCLRGEDFAACFLRNEGFPGMDCSVISRSGCGKTMWSSSGSESSVFSNYFPTVEGYYVANNIFSEYWCDRESINGITKFILAINQFFESWYNQIDAYYNEIFQRLDPIADFLGPRHSPTVPNKFDMESIEIALMGLVTVPSVKSAFQLPGLDNATQEFVLVLHEALVASPMLRQRLLPQGVNRTTHTSDEVGPFPEAFRSAKNRVNESLILTMSSPEAFQAFASQQKFSEDPLPLPDEFPNEIFYGLYTYMFSTVGAEWGVQAVVARDTNPVDLATNATSKDLAYKVDCQNGLNAQGVCDAWWYSKDENAAYGLNDVWRMGHPYGANLTKMFSNFTTGQYLFENAYACKDQKPSSNGVPAITVFGDHLCISQFPVSTWNMGCQDPKDTTCEFLDHPAQHNFLGNCKNGGKCVPDAYMGPLLKQQKQKITRY